MLFYHPAFDLYHCVYRLFILIDHLPNEEFSISKIQILDFYLLFPSEIKHIEFPREIYKYKKYFKQIYDEYANIPDKKRLIHRLKPFVINGLKILASYNFIDIEKFKKNIVVKNNSFNTKNIGNIITTYKTFDKEIINFITGPFAKIDLKGEKGLKKRTNLFEFKYDE